MSYTKGKNEVLNANTSIDEMLTDSSIDRVMAMDLNWNIIAWNRTSEVLSGITKKNILGKNLLEEFPQINADQEMLDAIKMAFEGKKSFLPSTINAFNRHYAENHYIPLHDNHGNIIVVMNIVQDVTYRIKVEKQFEELKYALEKKYQQLEKASNELATFIHFTSRDIKEPLKLVYTSLELLIKKEGASLSNRSKGNLRRMQGSVNKMNLLIHDITVVASINNKNESLSQVDLNEILTETIDKLKNKIIETNAVIESIDLPVIPGYRKMLEFLFFHILDNALKFQDENNIPVITINCNMVTGRDGNKPEFEEGKGYLKISFHDNGIGFDNADSERIFNIFEKLNDRRFHGSGIGLTISTKIVEAHDGFIEGISSIGNGAVFNCYFPVEQKEQTPAYMI